MSQIPDVKTRRALYAAMAILFCNGMLYATWGVSVPIIKERFGLSESTLSLAMAAVAVGGIATMAKAGSWIAKKGSGRACTLSGLAMALTAAFILTLPEYSMLLVLLCCYGMFSATNDVACNAQGAYLESTSGRSMIGALHGSFSAGGLGGALIASTWAGTSLSPSSNFYSLGPLVVIVIFVVSRYLLNEAPHAGAEDNQLQKRTSPSGQTIARRRLRLLGVLSFAALVVEGAFYDWAAVYMRDVIKAPPSWVGLGYAAFSIGMVIGRLGGDKVRDRTSLSWVVGGSWLVSVGGLAAIMISSTKEVVVLSFFITGLGMSSLIPLLFSTAGKLAGNSGIPASEGLAATTRIAYVGLLAGPLAIGPIAQLVGLRLSLLGLVVAISATCAGWFLLARACAGRPWELAPAIRADGRLETDAIH